MAHAAGVYPSYLGTLSHVRTIERMCNTVLRDVHYRPHIMHRLSEEMLSLLCRKTAYLLLEHDLLTQSRDFFVFFLNRVQSIIFLSQCALHVLLKASQICFEHICNVYGVLYILL